ncbi:MAG: hypothetical protein OEZ04_02255 [Nitrospinota bacterium]|nr:hypothetical protein [Nitrospinota bacterium]
MKEHNAGRAIFLAVLMIASLSAGCADLSPYRYTQTYTMIEPANSAAKTYDDGKVKVRFHINEKRIFLKLVNLTKAPLSINWDEASYVSLDGARHKVAGVDSIFSPDRSKPAATQIPPGGATDDFAAPVKNVKKLEQWTWYLSPLFNLKDDNAIENRGKIFGLDLPIQVEGMWKVYSFRFKILNVIPIHQPV